MNRQQQNYLYFTQPEKFINFKKNQRLRHFKEQNSELILKYLLEAMMERQSKVEIDIMQDIIVIDKGNHAKNHITKPPGEQLNLREQLTQQQSKAQNYQLKRKYKEIIETQRKQKTRLQKLKQKQVQIRKQAEEKQIQQQIKKKQQMKKHKSQFINDKIVKSLQKRQQMKKEREERNKDYNYIIKSWAKSQFQHQKIQREFRQRHESMIEQDRNKIKSERTKLSLNFGVEDLKINQHQEKYLKWKAQNQAVRAAKMEQHGRVIQLYEQDLKKYWKPKQNDNTDEQGNNSDDQNPKSRYHKDQTYTDMIQGKKMIAQQKRKKMQTYWQSFVKQSRMPKIDKKKQQQLQGLIQSLESARRMKKTKNQKGEFVYEQLKLSDPTLKGMQYLQYSRELGRMRRQAKCKQTVDQKSSSSALQKSSSKKPPNYLQQLRQSRSNSLKTSRQISNKLSFIQKSQLTFNQKLQRVQRQTFKLQQITKLNQNQLKYGKFKTSDQILQYKQEIDNNHLQILKMKLRLAKGDLVSK